MSWSMREHPEVQIPTHKSVDEMTVEEILHRLGAATKLMESEPMTALNVATAMAIVGINPMHFVDTPVSHGHDALMVRVSEMVRRVEASP